MNTQHHSVSAPRVEWELLPSLRNMMGRRQRLQPVWTETIVSDFDMVTEPSGPFEEVLPGLSVREVREPDIFHIFFG